jgi:hypothetical protein
MSIRQLDVRPTGDSASRSFIKMGYGFLAMGITMLAAGILCVLGVLPGMSVGIGCVFVLVGGLGSVGSVLLSRWGFRELHTLVRFSFAGDDVVIEWRRRDTVFRTERVKRTDLVEVAVTDAPTSGGSSYGLVVGLKSGEIDLTRISISGTQPPSHYVDECRRMAQFLGVPSRTP